MFYIYKIVGIKYIGSTNNIKLRCTKHKYDCWNENSKNYNSLLYKYIREKNKDIELKILGVYKRECSKKIKFLVEQFYINEYDSVNNGMNIDNAFTNNKKYNKIHNKKYYEKNKAKIKKQKKIYYEEHKEKILKKNKKYREKNKAKIKQRSKIKINCPICNSFIVKEQLKRHQRTKKCKSFQSNFK